MDLIVCRQKEEEMQEKKKGTTTTVQSASAEKIKTEMRSLALVEIANFSYPVCLTPPVRTI